MFSDKKKVKILQRIVIENCIKTNLKQTGYSIYLIKVTWTGENKNFTL